MSRQAIAAALAHEDLSTGERLVAFSLASFADRDARARPGTPAAAGRAALEKSWFLEARGKLERRGLVGVEQAATGRGRASTLWLAFADAGPWWEGEINADLFEAVLSYSQSRGSARLLLAAIAALANERRVVEGVTTSQLCAAAGVSDRTYRRAQPALLRSGELVLRSVMGGRGNTNSWEIGDPRRRAGEVAPVGLRRVPLPASQRPLVASVRSTRRNPGPSRTVSGENRPGDAGVSRAKGGGERTLSPVNRPASAGASGGKGGAHRTVPRETPAKTPAPNARAGSEPQNPRTLHPPNPPEGGSGKDQLLVEETYLTERGRRRRRVVAVDLAAVREQLRAAGKEDLADWERVRALLLDAVGESTFGIWLARLELIAVDLEHTLVVSAPPETVGWVAPRFGRVLDDAARRAGRRLRVADEVERKAAGPLPAVAAAAVRATPVRVSTDARSAVPSDRSTASRDDRPSGRPTDTSAYPSSYTDVYTQTKEVS